MVRFILILSMTVATLTTVAQKKQWLDPTVVAQGKEPARSMVRSYNSADGALQLGAESLYMQPLKDGWKVSTADNETVYERDFKMPFAWVDRHVVLHMDAVQGAFEVFVNDQKVGYSQSTGTPAEFDVARYVVEGHNALKIIVHRDHIGNKIENYNSALSGKIGDDNYVISQPKVRVRDFVTDTRIEDGSGLFSLGVIVKSQLLNNKELKVYYDLLSPEGRSVASGHRDAQFDMRGEDTVRFFANIPNIKAWSHEEANLYTLLIKTQHEGRFMEYLSFKVGFRSVEMVDGELLINGKPIEMSIAVYNGADSVEAMRSDIVALKEKGINCVKVKSHPLPEPFYDLCDKLGLYVCDQAAVNSSLSGSSRRKGGNLSNDTQWENSYTDRALRMYYNSKNHPSVVLFSIADNSDNGYNLYQSYLALKALEKSRPVIYLGSAGEWNSDAERRVAFDPASERLASQFAPATISEIDARKGIFRISNNYKIKPLDGASVVYEVIARKRIVAKGSAVVSVSAGGSTDITVPLLKIKPGTELQIILRVEEPIVARDYVPEKVAHEPEVEQNRLLAGISSIANLAKTKNWELDIPQVRVVATKEFKTVY